MLEAVADPSIHVPLCWTLGYVVFNLPVVARLETCSTIRPKRDCADGV